MDYDMERKLLFELHEMNKNLAEINETLKVLAVQVHENGGTNETKNN